MEPRPQPNPIEGPRVYAPWERAFQRIVTPFEEFIRRETTSGMLLLAFTVLALIAANSQFAPTYQHFVHTPISISIGDWSLEKTLHHWINDGLMALFFFVVGLEIKREMLDGELRDPRNAALPIAAAVGGMLVPALFYFMVNPSGVAARGWAVPMATDIAFAVGILALLSTRIPRALITFLVALAIADDLGAVVVIALFYTEQLSWDALGWALLFLSVLLVFNRSGVRHPLAYFIVGVLLWFAMLNSGVHATLAGVLTALAIPARPKYDPSRFSQLVCELLARFDACPQPADPSAPTDAQRSVLQTLERGIQGVVAPLQRLEHSLHLPVAFVIIPLFAFVNAGIALPLDQFAALAAQPVTLGVVLGLTLGKPIGIALACWALLRLGIGQLPSGARFAHIIGVGLLGGIGFTMSIFISELGFAAHPEALLMAKTGILFASLIAGVSGYLWLRLIAQPQIPAAH